MTTTSDAAAEARGLPREPTARGILLVMAAVTVAWLGVVAWQLVALPERVPTHFGAGGEADGWSSRTGAMAFSIVLPLLVVFPMPLMSRLATRWPHSINAPNRDWWAATGTRLRRFERLLREDLWLIAALTLALLTAVDAGIVIAAGSADGGLPIGFLVAPLVLYLAGLGVVMARMFGDRYAEQDVD